MSAAKVELGRRLFYDADLSRDGTLACANCHEQRHGFADSVASHPGVSGEPGRRNAPGLANVGYLSPLTWADPARTTLERQVAVPLFGTHPVEMGMQGQEGELVRRLSADACYRRMFAEAFPETGGAISFTTVAKALAAFQRTLLSFNSPYDRRAMDAEALAGEALFKAKGCPACHSGPNFTDGRFHVISPRDDGDDGAFEMTGDAALKEAFRTPSLRNVAVSAPYLHDGSAQTLRFAIFSHDEAAAGLTQDEATSLEAFLETLTDETFVTDPRFALPTSFCGKPRRG
jgi:cytochrome c peroxidase